jgi:hypothetical protein
MTIEKLNPKYDVAGEYIGMEVDSAGDYIRVQDVLDRISAIAKESPTSVMFVEGVWVLFKELL